MCVARGGGREGTTAGGRDRPQAAGIIHSMDPEAVRGADTEAVQADTEAPRTAPARVVRCSGAVRASALRNAQGGRGKAQMCLRDNAL